MIPIAGSRIKVDATLIATTIQGLDRWPSPNRGRHDNQFRPVRGFGYWEHDIFSFNPNLRYSYGQHDRSRWPNNYTKPLSLLGCRYHDLTGGRPAVTVGGTAISLQSSGTFIVGSSTLDLQGPPTPATLV